MVNFSIETLTAPVNRYFDKATQLIVSTNPTLDAEKVNHDLKTLMFNGATALVVSTVFLAFLRKIALGTGTPLVALFYLIRYVVDKTFHPPSEATSVSEDVEKTGASLREKLQEYFVQGDSIVIRNITVYKITHYPMTTVIEMLLKRSS